ncbi:MAG: YbbR-like domain-containing protein [Planctomycetota bacterium]
MPNYPLISHFIRAALFEDWLLKFICLLLAVLMWFYIDGELTDQRDLVVSLRPSDLILPTGFELSSSGALPKFTVRLRGTRRRLQLMNLEHIVFKKRVIENPQSGRNVLRLKPTDLEPDGFEIISVTPQDEEALVELTPTGSRLKTVRVKLRGAPKPGYLIGQCATEPGQVNVQGTTTELDELEFVWTDDVDVSGADQDVVRETSIVRQMNVNGRHISSYCAQKVRATVSVDPVEVTRRLSFDVRTVALEGTAMLMDPKTVEVEVIAAERIFTVPEIISGIILYVEWPSAWEKPKDATEILGPWRAQVRAIAPPRVQVRGLDGAALPTIEVRGAMAGALKSE